MCLNGLFSQDAGERAAILPEQKQRECGDDDAHRQAGRIEKKVEKQDVYDDRTKQRQAERSETPAQQDQAAANLEAFCGVEIMAAEENSHECSCVAFRHGQWYEVEECVQTEHDKDESEQRAGDDDGNFHF
jgi:hypothetical protein